MMIESRLTEYVFRFKENAVVERIPFAKWNRIRQGEESVKEYANIKVYIAYAYILLENRKPDYCLRIDGAIYYFDQDGRVVDNCLYYVDVIQDYEEETGGVISLQHRKKKKEFFNKNYWTLKAREIHQVISEIW